MLAGGCAIERKLTVIILTLIMIVIMIMQIIMMMMIPMIMNMIMIIIIIIIMISSRDWLQCCRGLRGFRVSGLRALRVSRRNGKG